MINKVFLIGRMGADPEVRFTQNGATVATINVATTEYFKDKAGNKKETTEWHKVAAWGKLGEIVAEYAKKGALVYVEGRINTEKWEDRDGNTRYATKIIAEKFRILANPGGQRHGQAPADDDVPF